MHRKTCEAHYEVCKQNSIITGSIRCFYFLFGSESKFDCIFKCFYIAVLIDLKKLENKNCEKSSTSNID